MKKTRIELGKLLCKKSQSFSGTLDTNIYKESQHRGEKSVISIHSFGNDGILYEIVQQIRRCNMLVQQEIFFIGEMLVQAKEILRENGRSFRVWIKENFDFGYDTARNFCNVYTACMGQLELIIHVKPSVLYMISSKEFPKKLRDFLLFNHLLYRISIREVKEIYLEYQEKGFEAVREKLEDKASIPLLKQQIIPFLDNLTRTIYLVRKQRLKLLHKLQGAKDITLRMGPTEVGDEIFSIISQAMKQCLQVLLQAKIDTDIKIKGLDSLFSKGFQEEYSMYSSNYANPILYSNRPKLFESEECIPFPKDSDSPRFIDAVIKTVQIPEEDIPNTLTTPEGFFNARYTIDPVSKQLIDLYRFRSKPSTRKGSVNSTDD